MILVEISINSAVDHMKKLWLCPLFLFLLSLFSVYYHYSLYYLYIIARCYDIYCISISWSNVDIWDKRGIVKFINASVPGNLTHKQTSLIVVTAEILLTAPIAVAFCTVNTANTQSNMTNASAAKTKQITTTNSSTGVTIGLQKTLLALLVAVMWHYYCLGIAKNP
jgi:hypothetical protein